MVFETLKSSRRTDPQWAVRSELLELLTFKYVMSYSYKTRKEQRSPLLSLTMTKKKLYNLDHTDWHRFITVKIWK